MIITNALARLWPQTHHQYRRLPIFGRILDKFAQWSLQQGFDLKTARCHVRSLQHLVPWFQRRRKRSIDDLSDTDVAEARVYYRLRNPHKAAAVRKLGWFLRAQGRLRSGTTRPRTRSDLAMAGFEEHLRHERGLAEATIESRQYHLRRFLRFLHFDRKATSLTKLTIAQIDSFLLRSARRYCRRSMPILVATIRSFLRFQHQRGALRKPLHEQVETVRAYQDERLPQPMPWPEVRQLLKRLDRSTPLGRRDYTILLLAATYGLRRSEVVALTLEDIDWRARTLCIPQLKTHQRLKLPLTDEVGTALADYLRHTRPHSTYRQVFLRHRPPIAPMPVWLAGRSLAHAARVAGVKLPTTHFHSLRHAVALRLLHNGVGLKSISDILGHRSPNTTAGYLRLNTEDFQSLALPVPRLPAGPSKPHVSPSLLKATAPTAFRSSRPRVTAPLTQRWRSFVGRKIQNYLARQRSLGRLCQREESLLRRFDYFLLRHYPRRRVLTAVQISAFTTDLHPLSPTGIRAHLSCVRQFCRYLARTQPNTFVPDPRTFPKAWPAKLPCLLTPAQVAQLLEGTRVIDPNSLNPLRPQTMRLAIILMFCCGLRSGEVLRLRLADFDLNQKVLMIHESKFHKSRLVPLSASVAQEFRIYLRQRAQQGMPVEPTAPFLWNGRTTRTSGPLGSSAIGVNWHRICRYAQIFDSKGWPPRLHDLRHSFAVEALRRGYFAGRDAQATLPRLSRYMGHVCPAFTHRYLKFTEPIRQAANARFHQHMARSLLAPTFHSTRKGGAA